MRGAQTLHTAHRAPGGIRAPFTTPGLPAPVWLRLVPRSGPLAHPTRTVGSCAMRPRPVWNGSATCWRSSGVLTASSSAVPASSTGARGHSSISTRTRRQCSRTSASPATTSYGSGSPRGPSSRHFSNRCVEQWGRRHPAERRWSVPRVHRGTPVSSRFEWSYCCQPTARGRPVEESCHEDLAVLGLGNLGLALSERLLQGRHHITVWNARTAEQTRSSPTSWPNRRWSPPGVKNHFRTILEDPAQLVDDRARSEGRLAPLVPPIMFIMLSSTGIRRGAPNRTAEVVLLSRPVPWQRGRVADVRDRRGHRGAESSPFRPAIRPRSGG